MTTDSPIAKAPPRKPSKLLVNLYLALGIAALVVVGRIEAQTLTRYAIGIATEVALALLALLFIRLEGLPLADTARLRVPQRKVTWLAVAAVPGLWIVGIGLNLVSMLILGYSTPVPPSQYPSSVLEAAALAVTTMIVAPLCEEVMFRGYVQRAYEGRTIWGGVLVGGLIFALYHLRFQGVFALIPVALALGVIAARTESLLPGIALHAVFNTIATVILIGTSYLPMQAAGGVIGTLVCLGIFLAPLSMLALWSLWRTTKPGAAAAAARPASPHRLGWAWVIPLGALALVYGYAAVSEVLIGRFPEAVLNDPIAFEPLAQAPVQERWSYIAMDPLGREIGDATCTRRRASNTITLECEAHHDGYDLTADIPGLESLQETDEFSLRDLPFGLSSVAPSLERAPETWTLSVVWAASDLTLQSGSTSQSSADGPGTILEFPAGTGMPALAARSGDADIAQIRVPKGDLLLPREWAWRFSALPFDLGYGGDVALAQISDQGAVQVCDSFVMVQGAEPVWTPSGGYVTWKVTVTHEAGADGEERLVAWYDDEMPHRLIRYNDSGVSYVLAASETAGLGQIGRPR
jgi:membrane protease YdiL (CAAX protease family)